MGQRGPKPKTREQVIAGVMARLASVAPTDPNACIPWPGSRSNGYGTVQARALSDQPILVTHLVWEATMGAEPTEDVLHTCDNPPCGNPLHLFEGTAKVNAADMAAKGRGWWQKGAG